MTQFYAHNKRTILSAIYIVAAVVVIVLLWPLIADKKPSRLVQSTITGLLVGGVYALIALGIVIINKASGVFNFAHGWMMLLGGLVFYTFFSAGTISVAAAFGLSIIAVLLVMTTSSWRDLLALRRAAVALGGIVVLTVLMSLPGKEWQYIRAVAGAVTGGMILGLAVERFTIRPLVGQPIFTSIMMTLAISELLHGFTQLSWGSVELPLAVFANPDGTALSTIKLDGLKDTLGGTVIIQPGLLFAFVLALVAFVGFVLFFQFTNVGLAMRASAENQQLAQAVGLRVRAILGVAWAIAALLALVAGVLQGGATTLSLNMPLLALVAFPAVLLGGLDSIGGALVGGLVIGLIQEWANLLFPGTQAGIELAPYIVLMIVLVIRPDGLFGQKRIERI